MFRNVFKTNHPPSQRRGPVSIQAQRTPSPDEGPAQTETRPPSALPTDGSQNRDEAQTETAAVTSYEDKHREAQPPAIQQLAGSDTFLKENTLHVPDKARRAAVIGQVSPGPEPGSTLDQIRRRSLGLPNRITLDVERASLAGTVTNAGAHHRPHRPIHIHDDPAHASTFRHSIVHHVGEKLSQDEKLIASGRDPSSETSVLDAFLGTKWIQPGPPTSPQLQEDGSEEGRRCHAPSLLFFPHHVFDMLLGLLRRHSTALRWLVFVIWIVYVAYAVVYNFYIKKAKYDWCHDGGLISWSSVVILVHLVIFKVIIPHAYRIHHMQDQMYIHVATFFKSIFSRRYVRVSAGVLLTAVIILMTQVGHLMPTEKQMTALCGYFVILLVAYLLSVEPEEIRWGVVAKNLLLQVLVVYLMMVWRLGRIVLECIATKIAFLFGFSREAAWVLFDKELPHMLSIELLSSLTLTGSIMHLLYYSGLLQGFLHKTGILLELITGTTTVEAVSGALCTLFGGIETAVILEPYIVLLTMSELHTFITSGIASMTGVALAMYMDMGVEKITLMTVNFATFNGALAVSKVMYPETDTSVTTYRDLKFLDRDEYNVIDAGVRGAIAVLRLLAQLVAVLIAFIAMVNMANDFIEWLLENIGIPGMDIVGILSLVLRPLIFLMGIEWQYTGRIARFFATKTVLNEYFGYKAFLLDDTLDPMQTRECAVTVALLYGFSNMAHVGATVAYLTAVAPERRQDISGTVPRALLTAILTNLLTAALVGALVSTQSPAEHHKFLNETRLLAETELINRVNESVV